MTAFLEGIIKAITGGFKELGTAVLGFVKDGFIELFTEYTLSGDVKTITGPSAFAYFVFILMGISLVLGLTYFIVNMARRSK